MTTIADIMTRSIATVRRDETLQAAARRMQEMDVGALPVLDGKAVAGMVTDRDITVRGVAEGLQPDEACVSDVMSLEVQFCTQDQDTAAVMRLMGEQQLRRLPVIDGDKKLVGIVSLGDMAVRQDGHIDDAVRKISEPGSAAH